MVRCLHHRLAHLEHGLAALSVRIQTARLLRVVGARECRRHPPQRGLNRQQVLVPETKQPGDLTRTQCALAHFHLLAVNVQHQARASRIGIPRHGLQLGGPLRQHQRMTVG